MVSNDTQRLSEFSSAFFSTLTTPHESPCIIGTFASHKVISRSCLLKGFGIRDIPHIDHKTPRSLHSEAKKSAAFDIAFRGFFQRGRGNNRSSWLRGFGASSTVQRDWSGTMELAVCVTLDLAVYS